MARCYPWRDVISTIHDDMLSMARSCPWRYVIHGEMLSMAPCYPWRDVIYGAMLSMERCYLWRDVIYGAMLSMERCYPWRDVIYGAMLSMARCYLWRDVIITIHNEMVSNILYQNHLSHHPRFCYHVLHLLMYSGINVVDDDVHVAINCQLSEI